MGRATGRWSMNKLTVVKHTKEFGSEVPFQVFFRWGCGGGEGMVVASFYSF